MFLEPARFNTILTEVFVNRNYHCDELYNTAKEYLAEVLYSTWREKIFPRPSLNDLEEAMHIICGKITNRAKDRFFFATNEKGEFKYPLDIRVYCKWMKTLAGREFLNIFDKKRKKEPPIKEPKKGSEIWESGVSISYSAYNKEGALKAAVNHLLCSKAKLPHRLVFLAQYVCMLDKGLDGADICHDIADTFCNMNLYQVFQYINDAADSFTWLRLSDEVFDHIVDELNASYDDKRCYGEVLFKECFSDESGLHISISKSLSRFNKRLEAIMAPYLREPVRKQKKSNNN